MANTRVFLSGERIQGRSDDGTTANRTPLHDIDFTEYADQAAGEAAWVSASTSGSNGYMVYDHTNKNLDCRNQGNSAGAKICYYDLGASVNATDWRIRFRYNSSSFSAESTGGKSYYTGFSISNAYDTADTGSPDWFGLKFIADAGSAQTQFYGTDGGSQSGTTMSFSPTSNSGANDIFVEWHFVSGTCTCKFFTDSDYDTQISGTATVSKSTSVAGLRYFMVYLRQDNGGNGDNEFVVDDFEFINGTLTETTDFSKDSITDVPAGTRYEEVNTRKIFRRAPAYAGYNQTNVDEDVPLRPSWGGGTRGGIIIQNGHTLIGNTINKVTFRSKKNGTPPGTAYLRIWNNAGTVVYEVGSKLASEFPTSRGDVVFENTTATYTIVENDRIALDYIAGDASNNVTWGMKNSSTPSNENVIDYPSNGWRTQSGRQTSYKAEGSASWKEKGAA